MWSHCTFQKILFFVFKRRKVRFILKENDKKEDLQKAPEEDKFNKVSLEK